MAKERSPFGALLRAHRARLGVSQVGLSRLIDKRSSENPALAELGLLSAKAIANLESKQDAPSAFVRPRPHTVRLLLAALDITPGSSEEEEFLAAADLTRQRAGAPAAQTLAPAPVHPAPTAREPAAKATAQRQPDFIDAGRETQLAHLEGLLEKALAGHPQIVLLAGEPGLGKTWLITEICRRAQQRDPRAVVAWGECTGGAAAVEPFLPFRQALGHVLGSMWGQPATSARPPNSELIAQVMEALLSKAPALVGAYIDEAFLVEQATAIGIADTAWRERVSQIVARRGGTDAEGRFDQVARFVGAVAAIHPLILILEDLHWADERTCTLLLHLQRRLHRLTDLPLLIIGSYRPSELVDPDAEERHPLEPVIDEIGRHVDEAVIDLATTVGARSGRAFIDALTERVLHERASSVGDLLFDRTKGYPLFAVELLAWLLETGSVAKDVAGHWRLTPRTTGVVIPGRGHAVVAGRLGRLPEPLRRVLTVAAVQGSIFAVDAVAEVLGLAPGEVDDLVDDQLARRYRMVSQIKTITVAGRRLYRYRFAHSLFQEFLYESLSERERERMHAGLAHALVRLLGEESHAGTAEIAFHFEHARDTVNAARYAFLAGKHANEMMAYEVAADWFTRAIALGEAAGTHEIVGFARNGLAGTLRSRGRNDEYAAVARRALDDAEVYGLATVGAESRALLGLHAYDRGWYVEAAKHLRASLAAYRELGDLSQAAGIESLLSHACYGLGAYDEALAHARSANETAKATGNDRSIAESALAAANCEVDLGRYREGIQVYREALHIYHRAGDLRGQAICQLNTGLCEVQLGHWDSACEVLTAGKALCEDLRLLRLQAYADNFLGLAHEGAGRLEAAADAFAAARDARRQLDQPSLSIDSVAGLLRIAIARGDRPRIAALADEVTDWITSHGVEGIEDPINVYLSCARAREALGEPEAAAALLAAGRALLLERAGKIADPEARRSYLEAVPVNRALLRRVEAGDHAAPRSTD